MLLFPWSVSAEKFLKSFLRCLGCSHTPSHVLLQGWSERKAKLQAFPLLFTLNSHNASLFSLNFPCFHLSFPVFLSLSGVLHHICLHFFLFPQSAICGYAFIAHSHSFTFNTYISFKNIYIWFIYSRTFYHIHY